MRWTKLSGVYGPRAPGIEEAMKFRNGKEDNLEKRSGVLSESGRFHGRNKNNDLQQLGKGVQALGKRRDAPRTSTLARTAGRGQLVPRAAAAVSAESVAPASFPLAVGPDSRDLSAELRTRAPFSERRAGG
jgi:hypothetical protein